MTQELKINPEMWPEETLVGGGGRGGEELGRVEDQGLGCRGGIGEVKERKKEGCSLDGRHRTGGGIRN